MWIAYDKELILSIGQKEFINKQTKISGYLHSKKGFVLVHSEALTTDIHFLMGLEAEVHDHHAGQLGFWSSHSGCGLLPSWSPHMAFPLGAHGACKLFSGVRVPSL